MSEPRCAALVEEFEQTPAFAWLREHAREFGFALSYPRIIRPEWPMSHGIGASGTVFRSVCKEFRQTREKGVACNITLRED